MFVYQAQQQNVTLTQLQERLDKEEKDRCNLQRQYEDLQESHSSLTASRERLSGELSAKAQALDAGNRVCREL